MPVSSEQHRSQRLKIQDLSLDGKKVLVRVDYNVPLDSSQNITDDSRIRASLPTVRYILDHGGTLILMSHMGRPKGKRVPELSLRPCVKRLSELVGGTVEMASDCVGPEVERQVEELPPGGVLLLENLRFHRAEEHPDEDLSFAEHLAKLGDVYVNDAFGSAHRRHSSTAGITQFFPNQAAAGLLLQDEINHLSALCENPRRPFCAIVGGAKVSSKIGVLRALTRKVNSLMIGGAMAFTFLKAQGKRIGSSLCEDDYLEEATKIAKECAANGVELLLPRDVRIASKIEEGIPSEIVPTEAGIPNGMMGVDIGPNTIQTYTEHLQQTATIFWNGPMGVFEVPDFSKGTFEVAKAIAESSATSVVGGGDSVAAVHAANLADKMTHISTGGGASLEFIEYGDLPGIRALSDPTR